MNTKIQWHPAFCSAMRLELIENKKDLDYIDEYNLNKKPIEIDLLIITKHEDIFIRNEIGRLFRKHNIIEYKSSEDEMNIDTYFKGLTYACLYKSQGKTVDAIKVEDVTLTFIRYRKPYGLLKELKARRYVVDNPYQGIYYIYKDGWFATQIIVLRELDRRLHTWVTSLTNELEQEAAENLVQHIRQLKEKDDQEYADSVLSVAVSANPEIFDGIKGEGENMCKELMEIMKPEIDAVVQAEVEKAVAEAVAEAAADKTRAAFTHAQQLIRNVENISRKLKISPKEACDLLECSDEEYKDAQILVAEGLKL